MQFSWIVSLEFIYSCPFYFPPMIDFFVSLFLICKSTNKLSNNKKIVRNCNSKEEEYKNRKTISRDFAFVVVVVFNVK